jgi:hypothetical protein
VPKSDGRRLEGRNGRIWEDYCAGWTQEALAEREGIHQTRVSQIIAAVRASIPPTDLDEARQRHVAFLEEMQRTAADIARQPPAPAYSNGRMMVDEQGRPILDYGGKLAAMKTATGITERAAKLLGLDAPSKVDVGVSEAAAQAAAQAAADALSRLHGE